MPVLITTPGWGVRLLASSGGNGCPTPYSAQNTPEKDPPPNVQSAKGETARSTPEMYGVRLWAQKDGSMWGGCRGARPER